MSTASLVITVIAITVTAVIALNVAKNRKKGN